MFEAHIQPEAQLPFKDKLLRTLSIALGNTDTIKEEVDQIDSFGRARNPGKTKRTFKAEKESDFIYLLSTGKVISVEAIVQLNRLYPINEKSVSSYFSHNLKFIGTLTNQKRIEYRVYHGREVDNVDADSSPVSDSEALKTYLTAGKALNNLKLIFPNIETRLSTGNRKTKMTGDYYRQMVQTGRKYNVRPR